MKIVHIHDYYMDGWGIRRICCPGISKNLVTILKGITVTIHIMI